MLLILNLVQRSAEGRSGCQIRNYAKKSIQTWLVFTWPSFHENGLIRCCRNVSQPGTWLLFSWSRVPRKSRQNTARRGIFSWQRRSHHLCYCTNWTKVASLSSRPRSCVRDSNSGPQPVCSSKTTFICSLLVHSHHWLIAVNVHSATSPNYGKQISVVIYDLLPVGSVFSSIFYRRKKAYFFPRGDYRCGNVNNE